MQHFQCASPSACTAARRSDFVRLRICPSTVERLCWRGSCGFGSWSESLDTLHRFYRTKTACPGLSAPWASNSASRGSVIVQVLQRLRRSAVSTNWLRNNEWGQDDNMTARVSENSLMRWSDSRSGSIQMWVHGESTDLRLYVDRLKKEKKHQESNNVSVQRSVSM